MDVGAGVSGGGEQGGDLPAVQRADGQVRRGQQPGGLGGALRGAQPAAPRAGGAGAGAAGLAGDQEDLAGEQVPPGGQFGEERGVVEGGGLQGRVGQGGGGVFQVGDRGRSGRRGRPG